MRMNSCKGLCVVRNKQEAIILMIMMLLPKNKSKEVEKIARIKMFLAKVISLR